MSYSSSMAAVSTSPINLTSKLDMQNIKTEENVNSWHQRKQAKANT